MSEGRFSTKQVITIITVTWILSLFTTLIVVNFVPTFHTKTWHEVQTFTGDFLFNDEPYAIGFTISGDTWRILWFVEIEELPPPEEVFFSILGEGEGGKLFSMTFAQPDDFRAPAGLWFVDEFGDYFWTQSGVEYITSTGQIYFTVNGAQLSWRIIVEEYY